MYRPLTGHLARASGATVYALDYRRAPEHPYAAALEDAVAAFVDLVERLGFPPERIAVAGDSAGGGLAVAAPRELTEAGLRPGALVLLSPWVDPDDPTLSRRDLVLDRGWTRRCAALYRGAADPRDPGYAPLHGELAGLPPMLVHVATGEILAGQVRRFVAAAEAATVAVRFVERDALWHSAELLAGVLRPAAAAVHDAGVFVQARLDRSAARAS